MIWLAAHYDHLMEFLGLLRTRSECSYRWSKTGKNTWAFGRCWRAVDEVNDIAGDEDVGTGAMDRCSIMALVRFMPLTLRVTLSREPCSYLNAEPRLGGDGGRQHRYLSTSLTLRVNRIPYLLPGCSGTSALGFSPRAVIRRDR
ncbi:MAG: hypothetical protein CM1200mP14_23320 [Gammaproteobacteria bacterium]|nr:MAG: hypothetical protein CM1200mP14_23320 [Gammaproteobacteria bacterium]